LLGALVDANEPGNAGAVLRTADAAGADAILFAGGVDLYNSKTVRASAGSLFNLDVVIDLDLDELLAAVSAAGLTTLATTGHADRELPAFVADGTLRHPTMWLFGSEAHGLPAGALSAADACVRVPIYGQAESLNMAAAAAICLYASADQQRYPVPSDNHRATGK
jgi:RNA methyltransferase, TrmH family